MSSLTADVRVIRPSSVTSVRDTAESGALAPTRGRVLVGLGLIGSLLAVIIFVSVGASRMITAAADPSHTHGHSRSAVAYRWSTSPLGFSVKWSDGSAETHLWW